jgi:hypothetical protein
MAPSIDLVVFEFTNVDGAVGEDQLSLAVLSAEFVVAVINSTIGPGLDTTAVLFVVFPSANVSCTVAVGIDTLAVRLIVSPLALIDISISMGELPLTGHLSVPPLSFIHRSVTPTLLSKSIFLVALPFPLISCAIFDLDNIDRARNACACLERDFTLLLIPECLSKRLLVYDGHLVVFFSLTTAVYTHSDGDAF